MKTHYRVGTPDFEVRGTELEGHLSYLEVENLKKTITEGDFIKIETKYLPYEQDNAMPDFIIYKVIKKYPNVVLLNHEAVTWKWRKNLKHCPSYLQLYWLLKHKRAK